MTVEVTSGADPLDCARVLAEAFVDEPGVRWVCGQGSRARRWFEATLCAHATVPHGIRYLARVGGVPVGAAVVTPASGEPGPFARLWWTARVGVGCGLGAVQRTLRYLDAGDAPADACTLEFVGVSPGQRGSGVGRALLDRVVTDAADRPIHLTTADPSNVGLYRHLGWAQTGQVDVDRLVVVAMLRHADRR